MITICKSGYPSVQEVFRCTYECTEESLNTILHTLPLQEFTGETNISILCEDYCTRSTICKYDVVDTNSDAIKEMINQLKGDEGVQFWAESTQIIEVKIPHIEGHSRFDRPILGEAMSQISEAFESSKTRELFDNNIFEPRSPSHIDPDISMIERKPKFDIDFNVSDDTEEFKREELKCKINIGASAKNSVDTIYSTDLIDETPREKSSMEVILPQGLDIIPQEKPSLKTETNFARMEQLREIYKTHKFKK